MIFFKMNKMSGEKINNHNNLIRQKLHCRRPYKITYNISIHLYLVNL
jgi:hypothetical protein